VALLENSPFLKYSRQQFEKTLSGKPSSPNNHADTSPKGETQWQARGQPPKVSASAGEYQEFQESEATDPYLEPQHSPLVQLVEEWLFPQWSENGLSGK
jgi:hypothetical protein